MWQVHDRIHQDWIAQFPTSITARVAYADFFTDYAWHARGTGFADKVTKEGWQRFRERIELARNTVGETRELTGKEPNSMAVVVRRSHTLTERVYSEDERC